jgi:hypothetical protein
MESFFKFVGSTLKLLFFVAVIGFGVGITVSVARFCYDLGRALLP